MLNKIIKFADLPLLVKKIKKGGNTIVLVGGCFDIFHIGHLHFLENAKKEGDVLLVALESDQKVKELKGKNRPIHSQAERAAILSALEFVNYVILLPYFSSDQEYFNFVRVVKPKIVAVTKNDPATQKKDQQLKKIGGQLKVVTPNIATPSTTQLAKLLKID